MKVVVPAAYLATAVIAFASVAGTAACRKSDDTPPSDAPAPTRRHVAKSGSVRPLPPHAISRDAVGPYHMNEPMAAVLADMPGGPRLNVLELPGVADVRIARVEEGSMLVGGQERSTFISIIGRDIARTEDGVGIGTPAKQLVAQQGKERDPNVLRDPRIYVLPDLPNLRLLSKGTAADDQIMAMILSEPITTVHMAPCPTPSLPVTVDVAPAEAKRATASCLTEAGDMVIVGANSISQWVIDGSKWRRNAMLPVKDVVTAGLLRTAPRHDDLLVISRTRDASAVQYVAALWRLEGTRFVRVGNEPIYRIDAVSAAAIGAVLDDLELVLEAFVANGQIQLGGTLLVHSAHGLRDVVPLLPAYLPMRRRAPDAKQATSSGAPDGIQPADAGVAGSGHGGQRGAPAASAAEPSRTAAPPGAP